MSLFVETIRIENGRVRHIDYHNRRFNYTRQQCYENVEKSNLRSHLRNIPNQGLIKCRILYGAHVDKIEYHPYTVTPINSLKIVTDESISYRYKYINRDQLKKLYKQRQECDDILIVKNGIIKDTFYANIALYKDNQWYTPAEPLLAGTMRSYLLDKQIISENYILQEDIKYYSKLCVFNAMIPFGKVVLSTNNIF